MTYQAAEQQLWQRYGEEPTEHFIELASPSLRLRVVEAGSGHPVVFIGGTGGTGAYWAPLVAELAGFRCLLLDRPGWGLSATVDYSQHEFKTLVTDVLCGLLDSLGLEKASLVGASIGNLWALRLAQLRPDRVDRIVLLGGLPNREVPVPTFVNLLASPIGRLMVSLPMRPKMLVSQLRAIGHGPSIDAGKMDDFIPWRVALSNETDSLVSERAMIKALLGKNGFRPGLTLEDAELQDIKAPTLMIFGTADPTGDVGIWQRFVDQLSQGELKILEGLGHMPWWDDPATVGRAVSVFISQTPDE
jgi:pimeloyl-ACP methyl ester carboxylesterase